jgi:hypothetical protein
MGRNLLNEGEPCVSLIEIEPVTALTEYPEAGSPSEDKVDKGVEKAAHDQMLQAVRAGAEMDLREIVTLRPSGSS